MTDQEQEPKRDRTWVDVQKKTFTRWSNNFLKERKMYITNLETDLANGLLLINLLEIISNKEIGARYNKAPKIRNQLLENTSIALNFIKAQHIKLVGIGPEDITDGNLKLILGLIWTLILRFQIQRSGFEGKAELLEWVRKQVAPYGERPNNFNLDWRNGRVLAALTDSLKPGVFPQDTWTGDALPDLEKAQNIAETEYSIPKLIDAIDIVECPDELAMMTYISYFRDWFLDDWKRREAEREAERLRKMRTADPSQCYAHGPGLTEGKTNNECPFTIQAVNYFGDPLPTGGDKFEINLSGPENVQVKQIDNNNGTYSCGYVPKKAGAFNLAITLRGEPIKGSPYHPNIKWSTSAGKSYAEGEGIRELFDNRPTSFTIHAIDGDGNHRTSGGDPFVVKIDGPEGPVNADLHDNGDGTYTVNYAVEKTGPVTINVTLDNAPIKDAPFKLQCRPGTDVSTSGFSGFTIQTRDKHGNAKNFGGDHFEVKASVPVKTVDNKDGTYSCFWSARTGGDVAFHVFFNGQELSTGPLNIPL